MNANVYVIEDYENVTAFRPKKTNPIQTQFRKAKMNLKSLAGKSGHTRRTKQGFLICQFGRDNCTIKAGRRYSIFRTSKAKPKYIKKCAWTGSLQAEVKYGIK
jgi:hypothetical protein